MLPSSAHVDVSVIHIRDKGLASRGEGKYFGLLRSLSLSVMNRSGQAAAHEDLGGDESREIGFEIKALMSLGCEPAASLSE
jgi:hypothetical protein